MADGLSIKIDTEKVLNHFTEIQKRAANPLPILRTISSKMHKDVMENFREEEDDNGRRWPRWFGFYGNKTPRYFNSRPYKNYESKMLQNTGHLRNNVFFESRKDEAKVYTRVDYAKHHQYGTKKMVARPFMHIPKDKQFEYITLFKAFILQ